MVTKERELWGSRIGFILAAAGSAIGLANIVRFPYLVGKNGGAAFIFVYLICLVLVGFPVFVTEIVIGRSTKLNPCGAFRHLGNNKFWTGAGLFLIITGLIVSSFYSALAGWILGYLVAALRGQLNHFTEISQSVDLFSSLISNPWWGFSYHALFILLCVVILYFGVRAGLERASKALLPIMFIMLLYLVVAGLNLTNASAGLKFLYVLDWQAVTPTASLLALSQAFFTLSVGQGTMITYGSYLERTSNVFSNCLLIAIADSLVSILATIAVFCIVFSVGMEPNAGIGLIFHTLPVVFSKLAGGYWLALAFFVLVVLAALTSEISAMEPLIAYLMDQHGWQRKSAVLSCAGLAFILGIPSALAYSLFADIKLLQLPILEAVDFIATGVLIPIGGLLAVFLVAWRWGMPCALTELNFGSNNLFTRKIWLARYFWLCVKFIAPLAIIFIAVQALGWW